MLTLAFVPTRQLSEWGLRICSENNFPTAAGLASSASGFAALIAALAALFDLQPKVSSSELSRIARQGSGSACRSLFGGFVAWQSGKDESGSDSLAVEVQPRSHWPELQALICVVSDAKKGTPSTAGMQRTVQTSPLLQHRIQQVVPERMASISKAIEARDFDTFAAITMADSNNFHACCLDTSPPIFYMNDTSRGIVQVAEEINRASEEEGRGKGVAYTYDAGPNAVLYATKDNMPLVLKTIRHYFPNADFDDTVSALWCLPSLLSRYIDSLFVVLNLDSSTSSERAKVRRTAAHSQHRSFRWSCLNPSMPTSFLSVSQAPLAV